MSIWSAYLSSIVLLEQIVPLRCGLVTHITFTSIMLKKVLLKISSGFELLGEVLPKFYRGWMAVLNRMIFAGIPNLDMASNRQLSVLSKAVSNTIKRRLVSICLARLFSRIWRIVKIWFMVYLQYTKSKATLITSNQSIWNAK